MKQRFTKRTRLVSALLTLAMVFTFLPFSAFADDEVDFWVPLHSENFPDKTFLEYIRTTFDKEDRRMENRMEFWSQANGELSLRSMSATKILPACGALRVFAT